MNIQQKTEELFNKSYHTLEENYENSSNTIIILGPKECGRQYAVNQLCLNNGLYPYNISNIKSIDELFGFMDKKKNYQRSPLFTAYTTGQIFCVRNINNSKALYDLLAKINDSKKWVFPVGEVEKHNGFRVIIITENLPEIIKSKNDLFQIVKFDYDKKLESKLCPNAELYKFFSACRECIDEYNIKSSIVTTYTFVKSYKLLQNSLTKSIDIIAGAFSNLPNKDKEILIKYLKIELQKNKYISILENL